MADITSEDFAELQEQKKTLIEEYNNLSEQIGVKKQNLLSYKVKKSICLKRSIFKTRIKWLLLTHGQ